MRLEGDALASEPSRLVEEAHTVPLFGGRRAVWVKAGGRNFAPRWKRLLATPPADCRIVIEAGDLRRNAPLRVVCEKAKSRSRASPAMPTTSATSLRLIDDEMREARLTIAPDARAALVSLIGGDRQASRSEIRKLALYAHGKERVALDDVLAVVADASALALDGVDRRGVRRHAPRDRSAVRQGAAPPAPSSGTIMSSALRYVIQLHQARVALDAGEDTDSAMRSFIPPVHFSRATAWSKPRSRSGPRRGSRVRWRTGRGDIPRSVKLRTPADGLADPIAQRALLAIAMAARRKER